MSTIMTSYRTKTQALLASNLNSLLLSQMRIKVLESPGFGGSKVPHSILEFRATMENPRVKIEAQYLSAVIGFTMNPIGQDGNVFEGEIKGETIVVTIK